MSKNFTTNPRRFMRFDAKSSSISGSICERSDSMLRNISLGGASFLLHEPIEPNLTCRVEIEDGKQSFHVAGKVAWVRKPGEMREVAENANGMYAIGVVFLNTYNQPSGALLEELIRRLDS